MRELSLGKGARIHQGQVALVDDEDYEDLLQYSWYVTKRNGKGVYHAIRAESKGTREGGGRVGVIIFPLANHVTGAPKDSFVVHKNGNQLDCTKDNLQVYTRREYLATLPPRPGGRSKYKGVVFMNRSRRWKAQIVEQEDVKYLGSYQEEEDAARAYDKAVYEKHGDIAYLNFPEG